MPWFTSYEPLELFFHNFSTTENRVKNLQTKSLKHQQANPVKIKPAGQNFKKFVHCSIPESSQSHLCWKIIFLLDFKPLSFPKHADYIDRTKKCRLAPWLPLFKFPSKNSYSHAFFQILRILKKDSSFNYQSIQVTFGHSQGATYNRKINLNVVLGKFMSIRGEEASNKTDTSTKQTYTTPFSVTR
jgi:hypothetical protein